MNILKECEKCKRVDKNNNCLVYIKPSIWWKKNNKYKEYCPLATHIEFEGDENHKKVRVGQQKQRKKI